MKPDSFTLQLQTILTALYEDIKGIVSASCCNKSKVIKRKFEDRTCARCRAAADASSPATSQEGGAAAAPGGEGPA